MLINLRNALMAGGKKRPPWDYRVAYIEVVSGMPKFVIPWPNYWNNAIPTTYNDREPAASAISQSATAHCIVSAPSGVQTGDRKLFSAYSTFGLARYSGKWRPAGIATWPTQPTSTQVPFVADAPVKTFWKSPNIYGMMGPNGESFSRTYSPGSYNIWEASASGFGYWHGDGGIDSQVTAGTRHYEAAIEVDHPTYGFRWKFVPCVKDNTVYICDVYSGLLVPKTGSGTVSVGQPVADDYCGYPY